MATQQDLTASEKGVTSRQASSRNEAAIRPAVDVFETADGIKLVADMPGVSKEQLQLHAEGNTLTIAGEVQFNMPEGMEALYADVRSTLYRCSFVLSSE